MVDNVGRNFFKKWGNDKSVFVKKYLGIFDNIVIKQNFKIKIKLYFESYVMNFSKKKNNNNQIFFFN